MAKKGLLVHYNFCTGCHSCEVACKKEHGLPEGVFGIKVATYGPIEYAPKKWDYVYAPYLTSSCDLCADRIAAGKIPSCVQHCQAKVIQFGTVEELAQAAEDKSKAAILVP